MAQRCAICGKGPSVGHNVSHAKNRTKRRWLPNLQKMKVVLDGSVRTVRVCTKCLKANKVQKAI